MLSTISRPQQTNKVQCQVATHLIKHTKGLNERIIDLVKKRSQLKQAVAKMVTEACTFLDKTPDKVEIVTQGRNTYDTYTKAVYLNHFSFRRLFLAFFIMNVARIL